MFESALKLLKMIEDCGYEAYIVGGFIRDRLLGIESLDIDITTSAKPVDLKRIFIDVTLPNEEYGAITLYFKNYRFEITTYRKEISYEEDRRPSKIEYIDDLEEDLKRRDFTMNSLCINSKGEIIDFLGGKKDIEDRIIRVIGDPIVRFVEDPLRILRAIRFATILNFNLDEELVAGIKQTKKELRRLSYHRKRDELDKIFSSSNAEIGVKWIKELDLDEDLEIYNIDNVVLDNDLVGVWSTLEVSDKYPFTRAERELLKNIHEVKKLDNLDSKVLFKYGLYVNIIAGNIKGIPRVEIISKYESLPIKSVTELKIDGNQIIDILSSHPGKHIKIIIDDLINQVLSGKLDNDYKDLEEYVIDNYRGKYE